MSVQRIRVRLWAERWQLDVSGVLEDFGERAALREYLGELSRADAEVAAFDDVKSIEMQRVKRRFLAAR